MIPHQDELMKIPDLYNKAINYVFENGLVSDEGGLWLEFGVHAGGTLNRIANYTNKAIVYGFDSFEGLPEAWVRHETNGVSYPKGAFTLGGWMPAVPEHVKLVKGWYKDTIPAFMSEHPEPIVFLHVDSDIYSSAKDIFNNLYGQISNGCIIVFDELVGYSGYEHNEWKAWWEFVEAHGIEFEWIGGNRSGKIEVNTLDGRILFERNRLVDENVSPSHENVAVRILKNPAFNA